MSLPQAASASRRVLPHPILSLLLASSWLVLSHSLALVHLLSAALMGWLIPRLLAPFLEQSARLHWPPALRLIAVVLWDIVLSNLTVARITLGTMSRPQPAWLRVPLATSHARVNALFASIITTTPGTVSIVIDEARGEILVHALNCDDAEGMVQDMKQRYEVPLIRIFRLELEGAVSRRST